jgi:hypothetical protein
MSSIVPRNTRPALIATRQERAAARRFGEIQAEALVRRAEDEIARELSKARISDMTDLGHHAFREMLSMEHDYKASAEASPFESGPLRGIAEDIANGIRYEVRSFAQGR